MFYFTGTRKPEFSSVKRINYDEYWKNRGFEINAKLKEREQIILERIPSQSKVLDLGCGNSRLPVELKNKGCEVMVGDVSQEVLKGFGKYGIEVMYLDLEKMSPQDIPSKFDYIILSEVLEHTQNPEEIITNLKHFTNFFFITVPNSAFYRYRLHLLFIGRFFTQWVHHPSEHLRYWSHSDFLDWLSALDLNVVMTESSNGLSVLGIPLHKWFPNLFGHQICYLAKSES